MQPANQILRGALRRLARREQPMEWLAAVWPLLTGRRLAAHTRPLACAEGVLEVGVSGAGWLEQLESMSGMLRREINRWWGGELVREVRFTRDPGTRGSEEAPEERTPFVRRGAQGRRKR